MAKVYTEEELNNFSRETLMAVILSMQDQIHHLKAVKEIKDMIAAKIHVAHNKNTTISTLLRRTNSPQYD